MNKINPKKLLHSKWTTLTPANRERHFVVSEIKFDDEDIVVSCCIEAVMSKRVILINWHDLKDNSHWVHGWK
jgi:tryptophan-rich hypothetical protein